MAMYSGKFRSGETVVRRDVLRGKPFAIWPHRVIADTGSELTLAMWPGIQGFNPAIWVRSALGDQSARDQMVPALASGTWGLSAWTFERIMYVSTSCHDRFYSVRRMFDSTGAFLEWYVNFEIPYLRTVSGIGTCDLQLDLVVKLDYSYAWKDEDQYQLACDLKIIPDDWQRGIEQARRDVVSLIERKDPPFTVIEPPRWADWRLPELSAEAISGRQL